jgi:cation diffusion facilitator family transporter
MEPIKSYIATKRSGLKKRSASSGLDPGLAFGLALTDYRRRTPPFLPGLPGKGAVRIGFVSNSATAARRAKRVIADQKLAMRMSFGVGVLMLLGKVGAYLMTGSAAILSDAAESVVHVAAVSFASYSLWLSFRPMDRDHLYGHDKIQYFSAGFEGGMIVLAALFIIYAATDNWIVGLKPRNLGGGMIVIVVATLINGLLGWYLLWIGRRSKSLILVANGHHVLTDFYTSAGVIIGLVLVLWTGKWQFDPLCAILVALNILWTGIKLIREAFGGLMDEADPEVTRQAQEVLDRQVVGLGCAYHGLRQRRAGNNIWIEMHLIFDGGLPLSEAHARATRVENAIEQSFKGSSVQVTTHLEAAQDHARVHQHDHFTDLKTP